MEELLKKIPIELDDSLFERVVQEVNQAMEKNRGIIDEEIDKAVAKKAEIVRQEAEIKAETANAARLAQEKEKDAIITSLQQELEVRAPFEFCFVSVESC